MGHLRAGRGGRSVLCSGLRVFLDGDAPGPSQGVDVVGNGSLREGRLYHLVREHDAVRERTLEITFLEPGVEAYVFTFG